MMLCFAFAAPNESREGLDSPWEPLFVSAQGGHADLRGVGHRLRHDNGRTFAVVGSPSSGVAGGVRLLRCSGFSPERIEHPCAGSTHC